MAKNLNLQEIEQEWQNYWLKEGIYGFDENSEKPVFSIDTPPPTVSGKMHLGHAFSYSQQDFIARYKRMKGFNVFYPFGTDDNGLATDKLIEKTKKIKSSEMPRKEYVKLCLDTLIDLRKEYISDWKAIGMSCDWKINYTTIDEFSQKISQKSFLDLYEMKRIYRKKSPIMVCPQCHTAIAQVELEDKEKESALIYIEVKAETGDKLIFATTRPELLPACMGISVHPEDKRYRHLIGKKIKLPLINREVILTADEATNPEYGSGVVYYCSYGGLECIEWLARHPEAKPVHAMELNGKFNELAGKYHGMNSEEARKEIIQDLKKAGALIKEEKLNHIVNVHERCGTAIEYVATEQWFIKYLDLKKEFLARGKEMHWFPEHMVSRYTNWIKGLQWDWCISRQRNFGVPFPAWYCAECKEVILAKEEQLPVDPLEDKPIEKCKCGSKKFIPEKDVLDTWATSSLTPRLAIEKFRGKKIFSKLYPMDLRPQAHDIITFWLFNTMVKSHLHFNSIPFKNIMISGWALDSKGKKMSKSKGNVIHPQELIKKYSADCLRYWAGQTSLGEDSPFSEKEFVSALKFITKLINATKFVSMLCKDFNEKEFNLKKADFASTDKWILSRINSVKKQASEALDKYEFSKALNETRNFFWLEFADYYIEEVKYRVYDENCTNKKEAQHCLNSVMLDVLKLLAPFLPHAIEEIMQENFKSQLTQKSVHLEKWPEAIQEFINEEFEEKGKIMNSVIAEIRKFKTGKQMSLNAEIDKIRIELKKEEKEKLSENELNEIKATMKVKEIEFK
ncbi:MAG: valine--tRNA ligase [Candidatus Diapherotrites archaeon]